MGQLTPALAGGAAASPPRRIDTGKVLSLGALLAPAVLLLAVGLLWPFLMMLRMSFLDRFPDPTGLTLEFYTAVLTDTYFLRIIGRTFALGLVVTAITAVVAYPVAWYLARSRSRWKHLVFLGVISPLMVSIIVRTIGWTIILGNEGFINAMLTSLGIIDTPLRLMQSFWSVVAGMVHILIPFMVLSIASVLGKIDPSYAEAATVMGANPVRTFLKVTLPLSVQGIAAGSVIVFCLTVGAYVTPVMLGRGQVNVLAVTIHEQMVVLVDWPTGAVVAMVLTAGTMVVLTLYGLFLRRHAQR
ncbi:ABC transporter permease [Enterovirga rhinocerotis]|uniref:Putative spermidine/putrescine transport system permease protein n=1 Tax=Enterovirga rhinocerotis TaxID=1339210 RepID=A0A4V3DWM6_9HYPH|nr:ABC transporter permease [Enterovirga rhinocerotis]TDR85379.1 putative spermidine/putrescine transport system permease protein [Enterovirga rhinocerotis]